MIRYEMAAGALPWIVGGLGLGLGLLYVRSRVAAEEKKGLSKCEALALLGVPKDWCEVGAGLLDSIPIPGASNEELEAKNTALNGEVDLVQPAEMPKVRGVGGAYVLRETVLRYKNGCVPYSGASDFKKCAPGTTDMGAYGTGKLAVLDGTPFKYVGNFSFTDPTTFEDAQHREGATPPFPLPVPAGSTAWWHRAQPVVCPPGTRIASGGTVDHREGASPCRSDAAINSAPVHQSELPECPYRIVDGVKVYTRDHRDGAPRCRIPSGPSRDIANTSIGVGAAMTSVVPEERR